MKKIFLSALLASFAFLAFSANPHIVNVKVNTESSVIKWTGSKIASYHEGNVSIKEGALDINHGVLSGGKFVIDMNSITCTDIESPKKNAYLVNHLKDEDFFNVASHPTAMLKITNVAKGQGSMYKVVADLTIKGITHSISFAADVKIKGLSYMANANIKIDRTKWDVVYKSGSVFKQLGDKIILDEIVFDISLVSAK